ncbi:Uncharacterized conserved protein YeaO, DUF488 family [Herbiconiux ginsengi]|uniref:Uncharacterized conserved protein YeaO, DUF488 family n=2 Tax=Herbiconiux ginsengi TaxID=381665 RepID=A0A1H3S0R6_9MICO|nr:Uncharacterized conserved protein YeaO, DUF488 family [Herbiconiux ginsengi]
MDSGRRHDAAAADPDAGIHVRRIYDAPAADDGARVLVDRLWPRGVSKERAHLDHWSKEVAPSTELRQWYAHLPERFEEFRSRYLTELQEPERAAELQHLRDLAGAGPLTLLTATKEVGLSEAAVIAGSLRGPRGG